MLRAFKATFLVAIDEEEAREDERRKSPDAVSLDELKNFLCQALTIDVSTENFGNEVGWQSAEVAIEELEELPRDTVQRLYGVDKV